jgi:hypothetical protein
VYSIQTGAATLSTDAPPNEREVHVRIGTEPTDNQVVVNGQDITNAVCSLSWSSSPRHGNTLRLDFLGADRAEFTGKAQVTLTETTRRALLALGWTPPAVA